MLGIIEQDSFRKTKNKNKKVLGMWRHRSQELLGGTWWLGETIVFHFSHHAEFMTTSFLHQTEASFPPWYEL
jgi:hypothetical protein